MSILEPFFYQLDLLVGFGAPILVFILYRTKKISQFSWYIFWIGALIGLTWEIPMFIGSYENIFVTIEQIRPYPTHYLVFMISHTLWDGGLFLIGYWLVKLMCKEPNFESFNIKELSILIVFGQIQEILVEFGATSNNTWVFIVYWWNPALFYINGYPITLYPQICWLYGILIFYLVILKLKTKFNE